MTEQPPAPEFTSFSRDVRARAAAYAGITAAYGAGVGHDVPTLLMFGLFAASALWSLAFEKKLHHLFFSSPIKIGLILAGTVSFVIFLAGTLEDIQGRFPFLLTRFLFWNAIIFALSRNKPESDLWTLGIISLTFFMISGSSGRSASFVPLLLFCTICFLYAFQRITVLRCGPAGEVERRGTALTFYMFLFAVELGALAFATFPRSFFRRPPELGTPEARAERSRNRPDPEGPIRTGIPRNPDFMNLTNFKRIKRDPREALLVRVQDAEGKAVSPYQAPYLRGAILDTYRNGTWSATPEKMRLQAVAGGWTRLTSAPEGRPIIKQHILATPLAGDLSFSVPNPVRVAWPMAGYDPTGILYFPEPLRENLEYDLESALVPVDIPVVPIEAVADAPPRCLRLPPGLDALRELAAEKGGWPKTVGSRARQIQIFLMRNGFSYSLDPFVPRNGVDPVEYFLVESRKGCCVHYASALALMCRAVGVPTRIATGFQLHDPDPLGTYRVRNLDAHAWVEVWFGPDHGWRAFDATPGETPPVLPEGDPVATLQMDKRAPVATGAPERRWDHFILDYNPSLQSGVLDQVTRGLGSAASATGRFLMAPVTLGLIGGLLFLALLAWRLTPHTKRRRLRQLASGFRDSTTIDFYRDFLWALALRGIRKPPSMTGLEFAGVLRSALPAEDAGFVTCKFYEARYRGEPPTPEERRRIDAIIDAILASPKAPARPKTSPPPRPP